MALHQLRSVTIGVPDPAPVATYYAEFGLQPEDESSFSTSDGGRQLYLQKAPTRRLVEMVVGADDHDDLARAGAALAKAGHHHQLAGGRLTTVEPETGVSVALEVTPRLAQGVTAPVPYNGPGRPDRRGQRSAAVLRQDRVRPRKLGHVVVTTTNFGATSHFFSDLVGFKVSDYIGDVGVFLRCSTDHHNLLVLSSSVVFLHHTAWQVDDVDEIGRGAAALLEGHPERHVWGLGRHHAGSNFFWYLRDPAGNYSEYYADLDYIPEDAVWAPETHAGYLGLYNWGPPPPSSFLRPDDLMELATKRRAVGV
jgi:glyoxalase/bleomycin resistance protein/dioxygenase superfamily protein